MDYTPKNFSPRVKSVSPPARSTFAHAGFTRVFGSRRDGEVRIVKD